MSRRDRNQVIEPGAGHPRLVTTNAGYASAGTAAADGVPTSCSLVTDTTILGGAIGQDVHLAGLPAAYGAIVRRRGDEYVCVQLDLRPCWHPRGACRGSVRDHFLLALCNRGAELRSYSAQPCCSGPAVRGDDRRDEQALAPLRAEGRGLRTRVPPWPARTHRCLLTHL